FFNAFAAYCPLLSDSIGSPSGGRLPDPDDGACSTAFLKISSPVVPCEVCIALVASVSTTIATMKPQVSFSRRSPVFLTPRILLAAYPPNWLDKPPPLEFCARTTKISRMLISIINPIINAYILLFQFFDLGRKVSLFLRKLPNQFLQYFDGFFLFSLFHQDFDQRFGNDGIS